MIKGSDVKLYLGILDNPSNIGKLDKSFGRKKYKNKKISKFFAKMFDFFLNISIPNMVLKTPITIFLC